MHEEVKKDIDYLFIIKSLIASCKEKFRVKTPYMEFYSYSNC